MALKDWKEEIKGKFWANKNGNDSIQVNFGETSMLYFVSGKKINTKSFKTKTQALRFAKQYMRTH